ncbi:MAG: multifunctional oxoglutarate decarboxylase/oxoglutarate dehydrogenase thiamine pyrophosphate-binding subunit/dihydrolipoyllysine-residue succinyltransferase subunit, partial [Nonomuraea sp.]|nr:multifunctional oxoglutarate decarboxylase/oxoglutarate dehydrogenase thiamine pyrophosphate-binding subunit/dihydrolipoyllysine-residue succinyltransferase subunit [Nonomuraea sp.]
VRVGQQAYEYRQAFRKDVVIDLICYRRRGHNEGDNPAFTQPLMYDLIDAKRSTRKLYTEALIGRGDITVEEAEGALRDYQAKLEQAFTETREAAKKPQESDLKVPPTEVVKWSHDDTPTAISDETLKRIIDTQLNMPEGFTMHPRLAPVLQRRGQMVESDTIDWSTGEALAFGSLLIDGHPVRLVGQDSRRGTFTQRHAVLVDRMTGEEHTPLKTFNKGTTKFYVYDSLLSEFAALGFEYGYSVVRPEALVLWEAQFGDFVNGAQTIIDEFISSGEQKWGQKSSVVLLLPHGFEGQGPDHSSARIERFLQTCALDNMTVAQPTTPANYFHLLRWQVESGRHKPMVVFTPKVLLRHKRATSKASDFTTGTFQPVLGDTTVDPSKVTKVVLCSGKVYYDLEHGREQSGRDDVAIVRLERLYPFPADELTAELGRYSANAELVWVQDEPVNMGPWPYLTLKLVEDPKLLGGRPLGRVSRTPNSSPASGSHNAHDTELEQILTQVFG